MYENRKLIEIWRRKGMETVKKFSWTDYGKKLLYIYYIILKERPSL